MLKLKKTCIGCLTVALLTTLMLAMPTQATPRGSGPVVYVTSQGLFYDAIIGAELLPNQGPFQLLVPGGPADLTTEFGPGDQGYVGGRWWIDLNGDNIQDENDKYFSCPLLGPGRMMP